MSKAIAPNRRYIGSYYYSHYWGHWDKIVGVNGNRWVAQAVNLEGIPIHKAREHMTPLDTGCFAVTPFKILNRKGK